MTRNKISWCLAPDGAPGFSWNPSCGCGPVSAGCVHCWSARLASTRLAHLPEYQGLAKDGVWAGHARFLPDRLAEPLRHRKPAGICVSLMGDLWHEDIGFEQIAAVFGVAAACPQHRFYFLTKRAKRMREWAEWIGEESRPLDKCFAAASEILGRVDIRDFDQWPLTNCWLGVSVEDQATADERIPELLQTPAAVRFVSYEPALGPVDMVDWMANQDAEQDTTAAAIARGEEHGIDWVVCGAESGPGARSMQDDWVRSIRDQCRSARVPLWFKQAMRNGKLDHEPMLDGRTWRGMPKETRR